MLPVLLVGWLTTMSLSRILILRSRSGTPLLIPTNRLKRSWPKMRDILLATVAAAASPSTLAGKQAMTTLWVSIRPIEYPFES
ncbi:hypothetical protein BDV97DRAFT_412468 [Delphinella strobiligena]|nr:hypothetical protein BDV97DRAFT_412468 [Delphinella strobiligena]